MFADDLLLFGEASQRQADVMMNCLEKFCHASGEKVNIAKSSIFFSKNVPATLKGRIKASMGMEISSEIGNYLGFPLSKRRKPTEKFQYIVDRVKSKLAGWKANCLSLAGRVTLAKSVLSSIPLYPMQVASIPVRICNEVQRLQRNFIWGKTQNRGYHPIGWETILHPRNAGGLGLKRMTSMNIACGVKLAWRLISGSDGLWAECLQNKYMLREDDSLLSAKPSDSPLWKFICNQKKYLDQGIRWQIRNGEYVNFFDDYWLVPGIKLKDVATRPLTREESCSKVKDWVSFGTWDFERLSYVFPPDVIQKFITSLPPLQHSGNDVMTWNATPSGIFTLKSAYHLIEEDNTVTTNSIYKMIWKWKGAERIRFLMWMVAHNRLPTNVWRSSWSQASAMCDWCNSSVEDTLHILRDCPYVRCLWSQLVNRRYISKFFSLSLQDSISFNLKENLGKHTEHWDLLWGVSIWKLWSWRNKFIFEPHCQKPYDPALTILAVWKSYVHPPTGSGSKKGKTTIQSTLWKPPLLIGLN